MDSKKFYDKLRGSSIYPTIPQSAVVALDAIIQRCLFHKVKLDEVAYIMATAKHEVGANLIPRRETMNYSVEGLLKTFPRNRISTAEVQRLGRKAGEPALSQSRQAEIANTVYQNRYGNGNKASGDGWRYRGGGFPQTTFKDNFAKVGKIVGFDLVKYPEKITDLNIAVAALVDGMVFGIYTNKKLSDYDLPKQYTPARAIVNADVAKNGAAIAKDANIFRNALQHAGYSENASTVAQNDVNVNLLTKIIELIRKVFNK